jgi:type 1 fimbria pilin
MICMHFIRFVLAAAARLGAARRRLCRISATLCVAALATPAHAFCTVGPKSDFTPLEFGSLTVDSSIPNGATIGQPKHWRLSVTCDKATSGQDAPTALRLESATGEMPGTDLWATALAGIGMRVSVNGSVISSSPTFYAQHPGDGTTQTYEMSLELIKTGPVRPSNFTADVFTLTGRSAAGDVQHLGRERIVDTLFNGIACTIMEDSRSKIVDLGVWPLSDFGGVGSVTGTQRVSLHLQCDPHGTPDATPLSVQFDGTAVSGHGDLLQVAGEPAATGIGIRLHNPDTGAPFPLNQQVSLGIAQQTGQRDLNLNVDYYQYAEHVTAGEANAVVTFRIDIR